MVDDLDDLRLLDPVHRLGLLVIIHQNDTLLAHVQKPSSGYEPFEMSLLVKDREISELLLGH